MGEPEGVVIVTGSAGMIGSAVVNRLAGRFRVIGFDTRRPPDPPPAAEPVYVDLTSTEEVRKGLQDVRERHGSRLVSVIHLAAYYDFSGAPSPRYEEITVRGTQRLLSGLQSFDVRQFVFSSTMLVHAPTTPGRPVTEDSTIDARWPYPQSKVRTEQVIRKERGHIPSVTLRIAGVYDDGCDSIPLAHQIQRILEGRITGSLFPGDLSHGTSYLHLEDLVDAIERVVERRGELPQETVLLLGEPEVMSYGELQKAFGQQLRGLNWQTIPIPSALAKVGAWLMQQVPVMDDSFIKPWMIDRADDHYELDISRARKLLGWEPRHSLRDTIPRMAAVLKQDPLGWYKRNGLEPPPALKSHGQHAPSPA